jgi:hypothetical protein
VIALWLGREQLETTQMYLHADLVIKERGLARTKPLDSKPGRVALSAKDSMSENTAALAPPTRLVSPRQARSRT